MSAVSADESSSTADVRLLRLLRRPENRTCCDCSRPRPTWAALRHVILDSTPQTIGGFCCILCSGVHRSLGTHLCFVRSVHLDVWREEEIAAMQSTGNDYINQLFEARLSNTKKIAPKADAEQRKEFIHQKYVLQAFVREGTRLEYPPTLTRTASISSSSNAHGISNATPRSPELTRSNNAETLQSNALSSSLRTSSLSAGRNDHRVSTPSSASSPLLKELLRDVNGLFADFSTPTQEQIKDQASRLARSLKAKDGTGQDDDLQQSLRDYHKSNVLRNESQVSATSITIQSPDSGDDDLNKQLRVLRSGEKQPSSTPSSLLYRPDSSADDFAKYRGGTVIDYQRNSSSWRSWLGILPEG